MRRSYGRAKGQKGRIRDFVNERPFTVPELKEAVIKGLIKDVEPRNIDRYVATMCWIGEAERTGESVNVNGRFCKQYRIVRGEVPAPARPNKTPVPVIAPVRQLTPADFLEARLRIERAMSTED